MKNLPVSAALWIVLFTTVSSAQVERIWLTHRTNDPSRIVVNWTTKEPGESVVQFGTTAIYGDEARVEGSRTLHRVEIPLTQRDVSYHYRIRTGSQVAAGSFKGYPTKELRVAVAADWQARPDLSALIQEDVHLLLTAGDHIRDLHHACGEGVTNCTKPFFELIDRYPELFRSTPFMPVLGNHDRQIRPRGPKPPAQAVYDIEATAFRRMFPLPGDGWKWHFDVPGFGVRFIGLDLNHLRDFGTTWQTCHAFHKGSEQFVWYDKLMNDSEQPFVVTLYNSQNAGTRSKEGGAWHQMFSKGTMAVTGFGYFAERAEVDGVPYYNTSLSGKGSVYADPNSKFLASEDSYVLMTFRAGAPKMVVELKKRDDGSVLDRQELPARKPGTP